MNQYLLTTFVVLLQVLQLLNSILVVHVARIHEVSRLCIRREYYNYASDINAQKSIINLEDNATTVVFANPNASGNDDDYMGDGKSFMLIIRCNIAQAKTLFRRYQSKKCTCMCCTFFVLFEFILLLYVL